MAPSRNLDLVSSESVGPIHILVADAQPLYRIGLRTVLERADMRFAVSETDTGASALQEVRHNRPNIVIIDEVLLQPDRLDGLRALVQGSAPPKVLVTFTAMSSDDMSWLNRAGASGLIERGADPDVFVEAVCTLAFGRDYFAGCFAASLVRDRPDNVVFGLTPRETEVLGILADGYSNREIALALGLSIRTVESHRLNIRRKTKARSLRDLVRIGRNIGLSGTGVDRHVRSAVPIASDGRQAADFVRSEKMEIV